MPPKVTRRKYPLSPKPHQLFPTMPKVHTVKPGYYGEGSVVVAEAQTGEGPVHRCALAKDALVTQPFEGIDTVFDVVSYAARTHGSRNAVGWRDIVKIVEEEKEVKKVVDGKEVTEKKIWKFFELSDYKYMSYVEFKEAVSEVARALIQLGITKDDVFNLYAQTRYVHTASLPCNSDPCQVLIGNLWRMPVVPFLLQ